MSAQPPLTSPELASGFAVRDLGLMPYPEATALQDELAPRVAGGEAPDTLLLVEHPPVLTLGAGFHEENLLFPREGYAARGIAVEKTGRGGDVTYHGPGQLVIYPVFDVSKRGKDLHLWLRALEGAVIDALAPLLSPLGIEAGRSEVNSGVWIGRDKVCAVGIRLRRWTSTHGLALNCDADLTPFGLIVPCGVAGDYGVTSVSKALGREVGVAEMKPRVVASFAARFGPAITDA